MRYLSVCSGIEAASVAWRPLGWTPAAFAEIEPFPCAVLEQRHPGVPNLGDITQIRGIDLELLGSSIGLLVGGTPCQSFSVAGNRRGLADPRGDLALAFGRLAAALRPEWIVWENVPGVLSSGRGWDFAAFVRSLVDLGYGVAWRVLDAQFFGVPQRRRRVFVVARIGDLRGPREVLFEPTGGRGNLAALSEAQAQDPGAGDVSTQGDRRRLTASPTRDPVGTLTAEDCGRLGMQSMQSVHAGHLVFGGGAQGPRRVAPALTAQRNARYDFSVETFVLNAQQDPITITDRSLPSGAKDRGHVVAFAENSRAEVRLVGGDGAQVGALCTPGGKVGQGVPAAAVGSRLRRLTPLECERLQGFPDHYTRIRWRGKEPSRCPDGHRYRALGNSMAVPVMRWIGEGIAAHGMR